MTPRPIYALPLLLALELPSCPAVRPTPALPPPVAVAIPGPGEAAVVARTWQTVLVAGGIEYVREGTDGQPYWAPLPPQPKEPGEPTEERFSSSVTLQSPDAGKMVLSVDEDTFRRYTLRSVWKLDPRTGKRAKVKPGYNEVPK